MIQKRDEAGEKALREKLRGRRARGVYVAAGIVIAAVWAIYFAKALFNVNVMAFMSAQKSNPNDEAGGALIQLMVAAALTILVLPWSLLKAGGLKRLAKRGQMTTGKVAEKSPLRKYGLAPTTFVYVVKGKEYRVKKDVNEDQFSVGDEVGIFYDPVNPGRIEIL